MLIPQVPLAPVPVGDGTFVPITKPNAVRAFAAVVEPVPPLATGSVPVTCVDKLTFDKVPPSVSEPLVVTLPVSVMPLTEPVPLTELTLPLPTPTATPLTNRPAALSVPEPLAPPVGAPTCNPAAGDNDVMSVFAPDAAALKFDRAAAAVVPPVPPLATATVPLTLFAVMFQLPEAFAPSARAAGRPPTVAPS